jgi:tetratricopeptide (TPR) repeat protein
MQKGRRDEAISHYERVIRLDPNSAVAHANLGAALRQKGRRDEAIRHFEQAIQLDPNLASAHANLGAVLLEQGKLDEAVVHLQDAIRLDANPAAPHSDLGGALLDQGKLDEAIGPLQDAIRLDPKLVPAHYNLGLVLRDKGRLDEAIGHLEEVVRLDPNLAVAQRWLYMCRYEAARAAISQNVESEKLSDQERADRRGQALGWLRANLDLASRLQKQGTAVSWSLKDWQTESALTSVRDPAELAKLPAAEREEWQRLWADVAALTAARP